MSNEPDFIHVWFGLAKLGCVVAFPQLQRSIGLPPALHPQLWAQGPRGGAGSVGNELLEQNGSPASCPTPTRLIFLLEPISN